MRAVCALARRPSIPRLSETKVERCYLKKKFNTFFIYGYMAMAINTSLVCNQSGNVRKEANVLFNDALNTFFIYGYVASDMVKDHSDSEWKEGRNEGRKD